jgi:hypothetical protein
MRRRWFALIGFATLPFLLSLPAPARDLGQWENSDPTVRAWFKGLMRPDMPTSSCCGEADGYWADEIHVRDGRVFVTITDDRDDGPLRRPHVPVGTEIEVPPNKIKWDRGNPTGHNIIFLATFEKFVFCFVQGSGT